MVRFPTLSQPRARRDRRVQAALAVGGRHPPRRARRGSRPRRTRRTARRRSRCSSTSGSPARSTICVAARAVTDTPLLAKGFFTTRRNSKSCARPGANAVLLILRDLDDARPAQLMRKAAELGLDTLVEAHDMDELARAIRLDAPVIGLNARDLSTFAIDRDVQLELVSLVPYGPDRSRRERDPLARARRGRRARRRKRDSCRHRVDARSRSGGEVARAPLAPARKSVRADAARGRRRRGRGGRRHARLHPRRQEPAPRAHGARRAEYGAVSRCVRRIQQGAGSDLVQIYPEDDGTVRGREAGLLWRGKQVGMVLDQPWDETTRRTGTPPPRPPDGSSLPAASARKTSAPRSTPCTRGRSTPPRRSRRSPESKITRASAHSSRRHTHDDAVGDTAAATSPRR